MGCANSAVAQQGKPEQMDGPIKPAAETQQKPAAPTAPAAKEAPKEAPPAAAPQQQSADKGDGGGDDEPIDLSDRAKDLPAALASHASAKALSLAKLELINVPSELVTIQTLQVLVLSENKLVDIAPLCVLTNLRVLDISDNPIEVLSPEIGKLTKLTKLDAYKMKLTAIPDELCQCTELEELNFFNNKIKRVPGDLKKLVNLRELNLASNALMQLPQGCLDGLTKLRRLAVFWNRVTRCASFKDLVELEMLQMHDNNLIEWPQFGDCHPKLTEITFSKTPLAKIPDGVFTAARFPALESIEFNTMQLESLNPEITTLPSLSKISLASNKLTELPDEVCGMPNLTLLSIATNQLTTLPPSFGKLEDKLVTLYMDGNKIVKLPLELGRFAKLTRFSIKGNPLDYEDPATVEACNRLRSSIADKGGDGKFIE